MKYFLKYFLFLFVLNINMTNNSVEISQESIIELKGKLSTSFILAAVSRVCYDAAKVVVDPSPQNKLEGTLNIVGTALEVASQAASKEDKKKKSIVLDDDVLIEMKSLVDKANNEIDRDVQMAAEFLLDLFKLINKSNEQIGFINDKELIKEINNAILVLDDWLKKVD